MLLLTAFLALAPAPAIKVTKIRVFPAAGATMKGGRIVGSNTGPTNDFVTLAPIDEEPLPGKWHEIAVSEATPLFRYLKYEGTWNTSASVAEIEFWAGDTKLKGTPFGTVPADGKSAAAAFDGDPTTPFAGKEPNGQYVGIDLGPTSQVAETTLSMAPGSYAGTVHVVLKSSTPDAVIRYRLDGQTPDETSDIARGAIMVSKSAVLVARAFRPDLAPSIVSVAPYRIGSGSSGKAVRSFHIGNSLTDTVVPWMEPMAAAAGQSLEFHRFTIPGAPTDWLWDHPGSGFGDSRFKEAFAAFAPIDHLITQPFAGHGRDIANEADYSARFFEAARRHSPNLHAWLYVQWPTAKLDDRWSKGEGDVATLAGIHRPAKSFAEAVQNHLRYTEAVRRRIDATYKGRLVRIIPAGPALARLKALVDAGKVPGMHDFFRDVFSDDLHMNAKGAYLVSLVHYACFYRRSPEGQFGPLNSGLTEAQAKVFQAVAWETVKGSAP